MKLFFSIIMPSYLGEYTGAAMYRDKKLLRAVQSVINQTFENWELIIISDGCEQTIDILKSHAPALENNNIIVYKIPKQKRWGGVRNIGIAKATGKYIIYLDGDDYYFPAYLMDLHNEMQEEKTWYYVDDLKLKNKLFVRDNCDLSLGRCGTSNIIHKREMQSKWLCSDYGEDYQFIKQLVKESIDYKKLKTVGYYVAHIPKKYDV